MTTRAFKSAESAFFWYVHSLDSKRHTGDFGNKRPCEPLDILRAIERLVRRGVIQPAQVTILRKYGMSGRAPDASKDEQKQDFNLWKAAMRAIAEELEKNGIVKKGERT